MPGARGLLQRREVPLAHLLHPAFFIEPHALDWFRVVEVRLVLLQRRLAEQNAAIRIEKTGRGRFRFTAARPIAMDEIAK